MRIIFLFIIFFVLLETAGIYVTRNFRDREIKDILSNSINVNTVLYNSIINIFQNTADVIHDDIMDYEKDIADILYLSKENNLTANIQREKLFNLIKDKFQFYHLKYHLEQIHFHLPEGISFSDAQCDSNKINTEHMHEIAKTNSLIRDNIKEKLDKFERFATYAKLDEQYHLVSFIPIFSLDGSKVAYFISYENDNQLIRKQFEDYNERIYLLTFFLIIILVLAYKLLKKDLEIYKINKNLQKRVDNAVEENRRKDMLIIEQSKLSAMGEMINSIAHQWRQPLNRISLEVTNIEEDFSYNELDQQSLNQYSSTIQDNIQYLSKVIDDFRDFYKPIDKNEEIELLSAVQSVVAMFKSESNEKHIIISITDDLISSFKIKFWREFKQVLVNLISNSIDSIENIHERHGTIFINLKEKDNFIVIEIGDNGKGINIDIANKIFEPYFTTKINGEGTGMGLYVSKITIETNMNGTISFQDNSPRGAIFIIKLPKFPVISNLKYD